jgi:hypothetical protein
MIDFEAIKSLPLAERAIEENRVCLAVYRWLNEACFPTWLKKARLMLVPKAGV